MRIKAVILMLVLISTIVTAVEISEVDQLPGDQAIDAKLSLIQNDMKKLEIKINDLAKKDQIESKLNEINENIDSTNQSNVLNFLAFLVGVVLFNDILILGLYIVFKTKGLLP